MKESLSAQQDVFMDLLYATSQHFNIPVSWIEKDYYISLVLKRLAESKFAEDVVFKGGTSLSKAYNRLINRFSEDVDIAVIHSDKSGNQIKNMISSLAKEITVDLRENDDYPDISKGSKFRKQAFEYKSLISPSNKSDQRQIASRIIVEISAFANPFPYEKRGMEPLVATFLKETNLPEYIERYELGAFSLNVLSLRQTLCEKIVSLIRFSLGENNVKQLSEKVRHFYDINALLQIDDIRLYMESEDFISDLRTLVNHDKRIFQEPTQWNNLDSLEQSPIVSDFSELWKELKAPYLRNLSGISYGEVPSPDVIQRSFEALLDRIGEIKL